MWKIAIYVTIAYIILTIITKIFDKRKVKKYGREIDIINNNGSGDNGDSNGNSNDGTGMVGDDKQQSCNDRND